MPIIDKIDPSYESKNMKTYPIPCVPNLNNWECPYCLYQCNSSIDNERCTQCYVIKPVFSAELEQLAAAFDKDLSKPVPPPRSIWNMYGVWRNKYKKYKTKYLKLKNKLNK